ncbi:MAG: hypothetical protein ACOXZM_00885 [Eubacteriales bacterium]|jgi:predicted dehydrogenase
MKIAMIGAGTIACGHMCAYDRLKKEGRDVELVALCDNSPPVGHAVQKDRGGGSSGGLTAWYR